MKAFCMSVHASVIQDFKTAYPDIEVVDWCMSGAARLFGRTIDVPKVINHMTWKNLSLAMIAAFQSQYDTFLSQFDLFIVAHPTSFAMVFEKYNKPILMINTVRYDIPFCNSRDIDMLERYRECLRRLSDRGLLHIVSNNRADQYYLKRCCGLDSIVIPSLGLYTRTRYAPTNSSFVMYHGTPPDHPLIAKRPNPHEWQDIASYRGIISIPYEVSLMSLFEYFAAGVPMFFPSREFWKSFANHQNLFSMFWYWDDRLPADLVDLNNLDDWIDRSDLYTTFKSPNTHYFNSIPHLFELLETFEYKDEDRRVYIDQTQLEWRRVMQRIQSDAFWTKSPRHICYNRLPLLANVVFDVSYSGTGVVPQHTYPNRIPLARGDVVFIKTEGVPWVFQKYPIDVPITLVTGVSDSAIPVEVCKQLCDNRNIRKWIGCNIPISHPKIVKMPIGVGEPERQNGDHETLLRLHAERVSWDEKLPNICVPHHGETHTSRTLAATIPKLPFEDYMREISQHRFVVCQRGNGMDTHRVCEVLLMGSIPVLEHSPLDDMYSQWNCLFVDSFDLIDTTDMAWDTAKDEAFLDVFWLRDALRDKLL